MKLLQKFWKSIKRNPVINVAVMSILAQAISQAASEGKYDLKTISTYGLQLALAYVAREFVVPFSEHKKEVAETRMMALSTPRPIPGYEFPEKGE